MVADVGESAETERIEEIISSYASRGRRGRGRPRTTGLMRGAPRRYRRRTPELLSNTAPRKRTKRKTTAKSAAVPNATVSTFGAMRGQRAEQDDVIQEDEIQPVGNISAVREGRLLRMTQDEDNPIGKLRLMKRQEMLEVEKRRKTNRSVLWRGWIW